MKKKIKKAFNVKDAQNGAKVETKEGRSVRIICYDRIETTYPIVALIDYEINEICYSYTIDGKRYNNDNNHEDLVIIEEIESKFNEGDYIVSDIGNIYYEITKIDDMYHTKQLSSGYEQRWTIENVDRTFHKWSLSDAKPGDVLCCEDNRPFMLKEVWNGHPVAYFGIDTSNLIFVGGKDIWTDDPVRPATFIEYNHLFKELKEENYEYNVDTHEITKPKISWRDKEGLDTKMNGYYIGVDSYIYFYNDGIVCKNSYNVFATKKQAKAALAMARISQIMANDERFGGVVTDDEWNERSWYNIIRVKKVLIVRPQTTYEFLAFHTLEQANLFLEENKDLIKDYYMMD